MSENQTQKEYKVQDLINDSGVRNTLIKYNKDRGRGDLSAEDAVEEFLTDMRYINAGNEVSSIKFISYLNDLEENTQDDINYKKALAQTYQLVDQQVNVVTGKDVPFLERAEAVGDYLIGGITSPLNIAAGLLTTATLGTLGAPAIAGSAARTAGTRAAIKSFISKQMNKTASRLALTAGVAGAVEAPLAGLSEMQLQRAERKLGVRDETDQWYGYDWSDIGQSAAIGGLSAGAFTVPFNIRDPYKKFKKLIQEAEENLEKNIQGTAAKSESVAEAMPEIESYAVDAVDRVETLTPATKEPEAKVISEAEPVETQANKRLIRNKMVEGLYVRARPGATARVADDVFEEPSQLQLDLGEVSPRRITEVPEDFADKYDPVGMITSVDDEGMATVSFLSKNSRDPSYPSRLTLSYDLKDIKALTQKESLEAVQSYTENYGKFLDRDLVNLGKKEIDQRTAELGLDTVDSDQAFSDLRNLDTMKGMYQVINDMIETNPQLKTKIDKRMRLSEMGAVILREVDSDALPKDLGEALIKNGLTLERFGNVLRADASLAGETLAAIKNIAKDTPQLAGAKRSALGVSEGAIEDVLTEGQRDYLKLINKRRQQELTTAKKLGLAVDLWRSALVIQPATTMRNIFGSSVAAPEVAIKSAISNALRQLDANLNGVALDSVPENISREESLAILRRLLVGVDTALVAKLLGSKVPAIQKQLLDVFDENLGRVPDKGVFAQLFKLSNAANVLNRMQDQYFKSAAVLTSLDGQLVRQRNLKNKALLAAEKEVNAQRKLNKESPIKLDRVETLLKYNKADLISDEMASKSIQDAMNLTFQNRKVGDKLLIGGDLVNSLQEGLNNFTLIKAAFPFPNFFINALVYMFNRPIGGAAKALVRGGQLDFKRRKGVEVARANREKLNELQGQLDDILKKPLQQRTAEDNKVINEYESLTKGFQDTETQFRQFKEGLSETIMGGALFGVTWALIELYGGSTYDALVTDENEKETTMEASFPLIGHMFMKDTIDRLTDGRPRGEDWQENFLKVLGGPSIRAGAYGQVLKAIGDYLETEPEDGGGKIIDQLRDFENTALWGKITGDVMGYFLSSVGTPFRVVEDFVKYFSDPENLQLSDRRLQKNLLGDDFAINNPGWNAWVDSLGSEILRGTAFEPEAPPKFDPTGGGVAERDPDTAQKQLMGMTARKAPSPVREEMNIIGVSRRAGKFNTETAEYNNIANREINALTDEILLPILSSERYQNLSPQQKLEALKNAYTGKVNEEEQTLAAEVIRKSNERVERLIGLPPKQNNLKSLTRKLVQYKYPILHKTRNLLKEGKNNVIKAIANAVNDMNSKIREGDQLELAKIIFNYEENYETERASFIGPLLDEVQKYLPKETQAFEDPLKIPGGFIKRQQ